eukprot:gene12965-biopygen2252
MSGVAVRGMRRDGAVKCKGVAAVAEKSSDECEGADDRSDGVQDAMTALVPRAPEAPAKSSYRAPTHSQREREELSPGK